MERSRFVQIVEEVLDSLPQPFRDRIHNVAVLVEDVPQEERRRRETPRAPVPRSQQRPRTLLLGQFIGVPRTRQSVFDLRAGPEYVVLYQANIEAVCRSEAEIREQIRRTVIHEFGHYFGMDEDQLKDV
jgi:predicted Zn-dependent protease with MMP-like domain